MSSEASAPRLSLASAPLPYDRATVTPGIVHLGVGAFMRAHLAVYVDDILKADPSWGIVGASLRRGDMREALAPQDFLYTVLVRGGEGDTARPIGSLVDVIDGNTQKDALIAAMTDPRVRIVSLTFTEKVYCHDPATGSLDPSHPDIVHDLAHPENPVSAPGLIVRALEQRFAAGTPPFTVLCCDNLPANGETTRDIVVAFARLRDAGLADRITGKVAFPSTMVDRIVPATTDEDRRVVADATGYTDAWPVVTEPYTQWVIEDHFSGERPAFETVGATLVADVKPFEFMKLRMLNGSHSTLAYLGYLGGYQFISETVANPDYRRLVHGLMTDEVMDTLPAGVGDPPAYRDALLSRFANPALKHRTWQIAMDGSQKLPQRLLGTIRDRLRQGKPVARAALGVAAWMRYVTGFDEAGNPIDVRDPLSARLRSIGDAAGKNPVRLVDGYLSVREIFSDDLAADGAFRAELVRHLQSLYAVGARETARRL